MEAIEDPQVHSSMNSIDGVKVNVVSDIGEVPVVSVVSALSEKPNGVAEGIDVVCSVSGAAEPAVGLQKNDNPMPQIDNAFTDTSITDSSITTETCLTETVDTTVLQTTTAVENLLDTGASTITDVITEVIEGPQNLDHANDITLEESIAEIGSVDMSNDIVTFQTEVLVVKDDCDDQSLNTVTNDHASTNIILSELGQNIELSDVLRSSDTPDSVENNNSGRLEVFNKEELLDILEGNDAVNDDSQATEQSLTKVHDQKILESQIAMKQLSRLKSKGRTRKKESPEIKRKRSKSIERPQRKKRGEKIIELSNTETGNTKEDNNSTETELTNVVTESTDITESTNVEEKKKSDSIVNVLVQDWDDDEPSEMDQSNKFQENIENLSNICDHSQESVTSLEESREGVNRTSIDFPSEGQNVSTDKSRDAGRPQKRLGRVIKKKVIFDPDNPDTFTKGKTVIKNKEPPTEKDQTSPKKIKTEEIKKRSQSKSPTSKMAWKKPQPKNSSKHNRRLTEVDRLLMDEGAVNMIYQLTPEAPKGKKNMRTKAEFIKKAQSSTPDGKEMKFRERKKEARSEEEVSKMLGGKQRSSISGSVKSPSVCEDFETHSADDSIIYRRHSSSSYSSTCMSPRRLSDVDASAARLSRQPSDTQNQMLEPTNTNGDSVEDVFMAEDADTSANEIINKDDCLSIKKKLNTKLSLALNKRKHDNSKGEKSSKQKKGSKPKKPETGEIIKRQDILNFTHVCLTFDQRVAEINIGKSGSNTSIHVLKELHQALVHVDSINDISVTLLTSECGTLCSDLALSPLLDDSMQMRTNNAYELAESIRCLLCAVERHSKLVVAGVWGACGGVALPLLALSDVVLAAEDATLAASGAVPLPGAAALTMRCQHLSQSLVNELVVFGRQLSASEAQRGGLVTRTLWPERSHEQARVIARDLAAQPPQSLLLKKQLLGLRNGGSETTFISSLEKERDLLIQYWNSVEGQELLRATLGNV